MRGKFTSQWSCKSPIWTSPWSSETWKGSSPVCSRNTSTCCTFRSFSNPMETWPLASGSNQWPRLNTPFPNCIARKLGSRGFWSREMMDRLIIPNFWGKIDLCLLFWWRVIDNFDILTSFWRFYLLPWFRLIWVWRVFLLFLRIFQHLFTFDEFFDNFDILSTLWQFWYLWRVFGRFYLLVFWHGFDYFSFDRIF